MLKLKPLRSQIPFAATLAIATSLFAVSQWKAIAADQTIDKYLIAPADTVKVPLAPGPLATDPITNSLVEAPFWNAYPLPDGPVGDAAKTYTFCFSQALIRHPWPVATRGGMMLEAARHSNVKVNYYNTDNDPLKQIQDLETCAAQKPDAIIVWPHSIKPLTPEIEKLHAAGFKIVGGERTVATSAYDTWIFLDDMGETRALAEAAGKLLGGKGAIAEQSGALGSSPQIIRHYGFSKALGELYPDIKLVATPPTDYSQAQGYSMALQFSQSGEGKQINAWFVHSGTMALGVAQAMKQTGRSDVPIFTIDGSKAEVKAVQSGAIYAIASHPPLWGDLALRIAIYHVLGKAVPKNLLLEPLPLITKANAEEMLPKAWGPLPN
jgi:galactofuranose transport system substrate-binding protein